MGREWYYDGRQLKKKNTFTDFIDVSRHLIDAGYTSPEHLYAYGGSAGGLLMGAVINMAPELYNGVLCGSAVRRRRYHDARRGYSPDHQ